MAWVFISPYVNSTVIFGIRRVSALVENPEGFPQRHVYLLSREILAVLPSFQYWVKSSLVIPLSGVDLLRQECRYKPAEDHCHHPSSPTPKSWSASIPQSEMLFLEEHSSLIGLESDVLPRAVKSLINIKNRANLLLPPRLEIREIVLTWAESRELSREHRS